MQEGRRWKYLLIVVLMAAAAIYLPSILSPPSLADDSDAVEAQIARNMMTTGDWVTARLDGVPFLEKSPLVWWLIDVSYKFLGFHDWAARIPIALTAIGLAWLTAAFGKWAFGRQPGFYAGLVMATCIGLWLFTRVLIPDVMLTFVIALAMWAFLRVFDDEEGNPTAWAWLFFASLGLGLLLKSLVGVVFPVLAAMLFLLSTGQLFSWQAWKRLRPFSGTVILLVIAAPWHILAAVRNPPLFEFTMRSAPGEYHGFLWFYFINEQLLRFLNMRYPRDYDTVPRLYFWLFHLLWLFPWSVYLPAIARLSFKPLDRAGKTGCWHCAGSAACWCSSRFRRRRSIIRCRFIPRSRCCWGPPWLRAVIGSVTARGFFAAYWLLRRLRCSRCLSCRGICPRPAIFQPR